MEILENILEIAVFLSDGLLFIINGQKTRK